MHCVVAYSITVIRHHSSMLLFIALLLFISYFMRECYLGIRKLSTPRVGCHRFNSNNDIIIVMHANHSI